MASDDTVKFSELLATFCKMEAQISILEKENDRLALELSQMKERERSTITQVGRVMEQIRGYIIREKAGRESEENGDIQDDSTEPPF